MERKIIGLVVAMPEEVRPIARVLGHFSREKIDRFPLYRFPMEDREIHLVQCGMGMEKAAAATTALIDGERPDIIISAGFGGGVREELSTGDIVIAGCIVSLGDGNSADTAAIDNAYLLRNIVESLPLRNFAIVGGSIVTSRGIVRKREIDRALSREMRNPVLDMETSAVAEACSRKAVPFLALRAVSDPADEELLFSIEEITDRDLNISIRRILSAILRNPRILPQMFRLARNAKTAGENLALVVERLVRIP